MNEIINQLPKMVMGDDINSEMAILPDYNDYIRTQDTAF